MEEMTVNTTDLEWEESKEYPPGTGVKVLSDGSDISPRVILLKLPPDWHMESHSHRYSEQHFILEGEYESRGRIYPEGTFRTIHPRADHGPFTTKKWTVIMVTWCVLHT